METIAGIRIDQINGLGAVPNNQDIEYLGFVKYMKPDDFLDLALKMESNNKNFHFYEKNMKLKGSASPFLQVKLIEDKFGSKKWQVMGHEGRHRMEVFKKLGGSNVRIPVHIFPYNMRSRHIKSYMEDYDFLPEYEKYKDKYENTLSKINRIKEKRKSRKEEKIKKIIRENNSIYKNFIDKLI